MLKPKIIVIGSNNTDMVIQAPHLPIPGETILGGIFFMNPGGKGANQAVAASRLGGHVIFISKIGNDIFGKQAVHLFEEAGILTDYIFSDPDHPSGVALITVDKNAENCIVVASGANANLLPKDIQKAKNAFTDASIILMQLEIPIKTVEYVVQIANELGIKIILNPAPMHHLQESILKTLFIITPNRIEAEMLSGVKVTDIPSAKEAARKIHEKGVEIVVITLGAEGALIFENGIYTLIHAEKVKPVDTTAAGDVFNGALTLAISEGNDIKTAVRFACKAAGIAVTRLGAQSSAPYKNEISVLKESGID